MGGIDDAEICDVLEVSPQQLEELYAQELRRARTLANSRVVATAYQMATSGKDKAMTIFWLKSRVGWSEKGPEESDRDVRRRLREEVERRLEAKEKKEVLLSFGDE